jgi:hypothetical protein
MEAFLVLVFWGEWNWSREIGEEKRKQGGAGGHGGETRDIVGGYVSRRWKILAGDCAGKMVSADARDGTREK